MNKLLLRQLTKYFKGRENIPSGLQQLFTTISDSYDHYEKDRKMLERSVELTSAELIELNTQLHRETEESNKQVFLKLKESLDVWNGNIPVELTQGSDYLKISHLADLLRDESLKRKRAETERQLREKHLQTSQKIAHVGSWELDLGNLEDLNKNNLYWSDEAYRIFGYEPGTVTVNNELFFNHVHPDDKSEVQKAISYALETNSLYDIEHRIVLNDGSEKIVHERGEIILDAKTGKQVEIVGTIQDITERKKAREKLQKVNEEIRTLFENMEEVFFTVDMQTFQLLQMSSACEKVYGYGVRDFARHPNLWFEVILEEDKPIIHNNNPALYAGNDIDQEYRIHHKNGEIRWLESKISPTLDSNGILIRIDGITSDITKRKEAEIALKQSEYKFRALIENSADVIMVVSEDTTVEYASDSLYRIMGYPPEEIIGLPTFRHIYPDDIPLLKDHIAKMKSQPGVPASLIYRRIKKDGTVIWCEGTSTDMRHDLSINGIVVNFRDITERINAESALKQSEQKFRALIENSSDVIIVVNEKGENLFVSSSIFRVTGFTVEESMNNSAFHFIYPEDIPTIQERLEFIVNNPYISVTLTYRRYKKDGSTIWCEGRAANFLDEPSVNGIVINYRDITERREYEEALKATNENLHKTNMELDKFVYSVSHDLRAPLSSILGVVEFAETETQEKEMLEHLGMVKKSVRKLDTFIVDILNYSRNARLEIETENIHFKEVLDEVTNNLKYMENDGARVSIRTHLENGIEFFSDKRRISILLNNLVSNAIRYRKTNIPDPFVEVNVKLAAEGASIEVRDNGVGISGDKHDKVFDMFYRVSKTSTGSGLGLYIVKEVVEKLRGNIKLQSEPGIGTTFKIFIPNIHNN